MLLNYRNVSESEIDECVEVLTTDFRDADLASVPRIVLGVMLLVTCLLGFFEADNFKDFPEGYVSTLERLLV